MEADSRVEVKSRLDWEVLGDSPDAPERVGSQEQKACLPACQMREARLLEHRCLC